MANPNDTHNVNTIGFYFCFAGEMERGLALLEKVAARDPLYEIPLPLIAYLDHYRKGNFEQALAVAMDRTGLAPIVNFLCQAAAYGELGRLVEAETALAEVRARKPEIVDYMTLCLHRAFDPIVVGLRKAGLDMPDKQV